MIFTNNPHQQKLQKTNYYIDNNRINTKMTDNNTRDFDRGIIFKQSVFSGNFITRINTKNEGCSSCSGYK